MPCVCQGTPATPTPPTDEPYAQQTLWLCLPSPNCIVLNGPGGSHGILESYFRDSFDVESEHLLISVYALTSVLPEMVSIITYCCTDLWVDQ